MNTPYAKYTKCNLHERTAPINSHKKQYTKRYTLYKNDKKKRNQRRHIIES